jgi:hypothetical protein
MITRESMLCSSGNVRYELAVSRRPNPGPPAPARTWSGTAQGRRPSDRTLDLARSEKSRPEEGVTWRGSSRRRSSGRSTSRASRSARSTAAPERTATRSAARWPRPSRRRRRARQAASQARAPRHKRLQPHRTARAPGIRSWRHVTPAESQRGALDPLVQEGRDHVALLMLTSGLIAVKKASATALVSALTG